MRGGKDDFCHAVNIGHYVSVAEAQGREAEVLQAAIPTSVFLRIVCVAIHLDGQPDRWAEKVDDGLGFEYNVLTSEFMPTELVIGDGAPQALLRLCWVAPHFSCALQEFSFSLHWRPPPQPLP